MRTDAGSSCQIPSTTAAKPLLSGRGEAGILYTRRVLSTQAERAPVPSAEDVGSVPTLIASQPSRVCTKESVITPTANPSHA